MLRFGWVFALVVVLALAAWELATGNRLPSFMTERHEAYLDDSVIVATMGTTGGFGSFLLLTTPFLLWSMAQARGLEKLLCVGLLAATGFFALYSGARNSFLALVLQFVTYFLILERRWYVRLATVACGLVAAVLWANLLMQGDFKLAQKFEKTAERGFEDGSIEERLILSVNGIWMALETGGRGVGADGYEETTQSGDVLIPLRVNHRGVLKPAHNVWVEILSEYGVVVFVGLMALLGWIARLGWQARRWVGGRGDDRGVVARATLVGLVGYAFYGVQAGSVLGQSTTWMFLATLTVMAVFLHEKARSPQRPAVPVYGTQRNAVL